MTLPAPPIKGQRVVHPNWNGARGVAVVVAVVNAFHVDILFSGWPRPVRAAITSLEPDE